MCGHVSVTDTFNILLLPRDQLVWWYLCDARCSNKHRMLGQFYRSCYDDSLQTKHTHQEIHTQPHLKRDKFTKLTEEEYPLKQRLPSPSIFVHLQTSREALMSFTHPTVNEYMNWNYLFTSTLYFLLIISFNLTDPAHNKRFKLMQTWKGTRFKTQIKKTKKNKQTNWKLCSWKEKSVRSLRSTAVDVIWPKCEAQLLNSTETLKTACEGKEKSLPSRQNQNVVGGIWPEAKRHRQTYDFWTQYWEMLYKLWTSCHI